MSSAWEERRLPEEWGVVRKVVGEHSRNGCWKKRERIVFKQARKPFHFQSLAFETSLATKTL